MNYIGGLGDMQKDLVRIIAEEKMPGKKIVSKSWSLSCNCVTIHFKTSSRTRPIKKSRKQIGMGKRLRGIPCVFDRHYLSLKTTLDSITKNFIISFISFNFQDFPSYLLSFTFSFRFFQKGFPWIFPVIFLLFFSFI